MDAAAATATSQQPPSPAKKSFVSTLIDATNFRSSSFVEDSYFISHLKSAERRALKDMKNLISTVSLPSASMWGIPLLTGDERADVVLLKFLRARDFKVADAFNMLHKCLQWRAEFKTDGIVEEDLGFKELEGVVAYMHGHDRDGHPVCYNAYGVFKDREMYEKVFGDEEKLKRFLRWRVQVLEKGIDLLQFKPGGVNSIIQVTDLKDMPKRELRVASNHILSLFQDNYPEMVARKVFINVPWYFSMLYSMFSPFLTQRTKSKFVIARGGNVPETLYRYIPPENVPVQYGGLGKLEDLQNAPVKPTSEFTVRGGEKVNLEIDGIEIVRFKYDDQCLVCLDVSQGGATITWDLVVGGWDLAYGAEFIPSATESYTIAIKKSQHIAPNEDPIHSSFTSWEVGKLVLCLDNSASRKRKVAAYRYSVSKPTA